MIHLLKKTKKVINFERLRGLRLRRNILVTKEQQGIRYHYQVVMVVGSIIIIIDALSKEYDVPWPLFGILSAIVVLYARLLINKRKKENKCDQPTQEDGESN